MKIYFNILFLSISIFFSLGFTTYQSCCENKKTEEQICKSNYSCCHSEKKTECTKSKDCKADCCLIQSKFFILNDFIFTTESIQKVKIFETIKYIYIAHYINNVKKYTDKIYNNHYLDYKYFGRQIISLKQSWLI